jgi:hypothetical protein
MCLIDDIVVPVIVGAAIAVLIIVICQWWL